MKDLAIFPKLDFPSQLRQSGFCSNWLLFPSFAQVDFAQAGFASPARLKDLGQHEAAGVQELKRTRLFVRCLVSKNAFVLAWQVKGCARDTRKFICSRLACLMASRGRKRKGAEDGAGDRKTGESSVLDGFSPAAFTLLSQWAWGDVSVAQQQFD